MKQEKFSSLPDAIKSAVELSQESGYSAIILSRGQYFVEDEPPLVRNGEELIGQYENGKLIN